MSKTKNQINSESLLDLVVDYYVASRDANGMPVSILLNKDTQLATLKDLVREAVVAENIDVVFEEAEQNPHVRRLPNKFKKPTATLLDSLKLENACLYPSPKLIKERIDLSKYEKSPYSLELWQGKPQLEYSFFDLDILKKYQDDPRYAFRFGSRGGDIVAVDETLPNDEQVIVEYMAVSYTENGERVLGVMLRYLCNLTPKYQRIWKENERSDSCDVNPDSLMASYFGEFPKHITFFEALLHEIGVINQITTAAFGLNMFISDYLDKKPDGFHVLLIPTEKEYRKFAASLDAILSENLNMKFFTSFPEIKSEIEKEGLKSVGSLGLWLKCCWKEDPKLQGLIVKPLQLVRAERSIGAHPGQVNKYDQAYCEKQKDLLLAAYKATRSLRLLLQNLPAAKEIVVPKYLNDGIVNP